MFNNIFLYDVTATVPAALLLFPVPRSLFLVVVVVASVIAGVPCCLFVVIVVVVVMFFISVKLSCFVVGGEDEATAVSY